MRLFFVLAAASPLAAEVSVDLNDLHLDLIMNLQGRVETADADRSDGGTWDVVRGRDGESDLATPTIRRARLGIDGAYHDWRFELIYRTDTADRTGQDQGRATNLYKAWVDRVFPDDTITQTAHFGLDFPFYNRALYGDPYWMFPNQRATGTLLGVRSIGGRYKASGSRWDWAFDVQESQDPTKPAANADHHDGLFYSSRIELTAFGTKPAYRESYWGKPGHSLLLAADVGWDQDDYQTAGFDTNSIGYGCEALLHWDRWSAIAEARGLHTIESSIAAQPSSHNDAFIWLVQGGYAIPVRSIFVEPAARFTYIDRDVSDHHEVIDYDSTDNLDAESGGSGLQWDGCVNFYLDPMVSLQAAYERWDAEAGRANANIWRAQIRVVF